MRRGLSLVELLTAIAIMTIMVAALGALASTVQTGGEYALGRNLAAQHGRVAVHRIESSVRQAVVSESFPGCAAFGEQVAGYTLPNTLVVWSPANTVSDATHPRVNELIVFCPDPQAPNVLLEIRRASDTTAAPSLDDGSAWQTLLNTIKNDTTAERIEITAHLRAAEISASGGAGSQRGAVHFAVRVNPSRTQWTAATADPDTIDILDWPQDLFNVRGGLRQTWCKFDLQITPAPGEADAGEAISLFGSAVIYERLAVSF